MDNFKTFKIKLVSLIQVQWQLSRISFSSDSSRHLENAHCRDIENGKCFCIARKKALNAKLSTNTLRGQRSDLPRKILFSWAGLGTAAFHNRFSCSSLDLRYQNNKIQAQLAAVATFSAKMPQKHIPSLAVTMISMVWGLHIPDAFSIKILILCRNKHQRD